MFNKTSLESSEAAESWNISGRVGSVVLITVTRFAETDTGCWAHWARVQEDGGMSSER